MEGHKFGGIWRDLTMEVSGLSISQMRPLERLYMATFSAYVTANKIACILRILRGVRQDGT